MGAGATSEAVSLPADSLSGLLVKKVKKEVTAKKKKPTHTHRISKHVKQPLLFHSECVCVHLSVLGVKKCVGVFEV